MNLLPLYEDDETDDVVVEVRENEDDEVKFELRDLTGLLAHF